MLQIVIYKKLNFWEEYTPLVDIQHNGLRYECFECDGVFGEKGSLKRHVRNMHKGVKI